MMRFFSASVSFLWGQAFKIKRSFNIIRVVSAFMLGLLCSSTLALAANEASQARTMYPFNTKAKEMQFHQLLKELRCLVCQNQDLADSHASLANDLRHEVYDKVLQGKSDDEILAYLKERYGDFILFKPPVIAATWLLWFGPGVFLVLGLIIFWRTGVKRQSHE